VRNVSKSTLWYAPLMRWEQNLKLHLGISSWQLPKTAKLLIIDNFKIKHFDQKLLHVINIYGFFSFY
jgi:hypothetical protein